MLRCFPHGAFNGLFRDCPGAMGLCKACNILWGLLLFRADGFMVWAL